MGQILDQLHSSNGSNSGSFSFSPCAAKDKCLIITLDDGNGRLAGEHILMTKGNHCMEERSYGSVYENTCHMNNGATKRSRIVMFGYYACHSRTYVTLGPAPDDLSHGSTAFCLKRPSNSRRTIQPRRRSYMQLCRINAGWLG